MAKTTTLTQKTIDNAKAAGNLLGKAILIGAVMSILPFTVRLIHNSIKD